MAKSVGSGLTFTAADLQYTIPEMWAPVVLREMQASLLAADFFRDSSGMLVGGGDTINFADVFTNKFSANDKTNDAEVTLQGPAQGTVQLVVDTWKEVSYLIEDKQLVQILQSSDVLEAYASQAGYIVAQALDTSLFGLYSGASQTVNDTASDVTDGVVRRAIESLVDGDVNIAAAAFFFHPTVVWHDLFGISKYTNVFDSTPVAIGQLGQTTGRVNKTSVGRVYGIPTFQTTQVQADGNNTAYFNILATPDAFTYAVQTPGGQKVRTQATYEQGNLGTLWTSDIIYGVKELRDDSVVVIKSRQSVVVS